MEEKQEKPRFPCPNCKCYPQGQERGYMRIRGWALYCPWCGGIRYFENGKENKDGKDFDKSGVQQH